MSGEAIKEHKDPLYTLLSSFAYPIRDAVNRWIDAVKKYRGEESLEITLVGMDEFEATMEDAKEFMNKNDNQKLENKEDGEKERTESREQEGRTEG